MSKKKKRPKAKTEPAIVIRFPLPAETERRTVLGALDGFICQMPTDDLVSLVPLFAEHVAECNG